MGKMGKQHGQLGKRHGQLGQLGVHKDWLNEKSFRRDTVLKGDNSITIWVTVGSNDSWIAYTNITLAYRWVWSINGFGVCGYLTQVAIRSEDVAVLASNGSSIWSWSQDCVSSGNNNGKNDKLKRNSLNLSICFVALLKLFYMLELYF